MACLTLVVFVCARNGTTDVTRVQRLLEAEEPAGSVAVPYYYGNPRRYQKELGRLVETGLPRLQEWLREAPEILSRFAERVLLMAQRDAPAADRIENWDETLDLSTARKLSRSYTNRGFPSRRE